MTPYGVSKIIKVKRARSMSFISTSSPYFLIKSL